MVNHPNGPYKTFQIGSQSGSHTIIQTTEFETEWDVMLTTSSLYISTTISCCERRGRYATEQGHSLDLRVLLLSKLPARTESSDALALSSKVITVIARKRHQGCTRRLLVCLGEGGGRLSCRS